MNSITAYRDTDQTSRTLMDSSTSHLNNQWHRKTLWKAEAVAFGLALLAHAGLWQIYNSMPHLPPLEIQPPVIEVSLVSAKPQAVAPQVAAPPVTQPQPPAPKPLVQPPPPKPKPKPIPKVEKPAPPKPEKPKPTPKPRPEPEAEAEPTPQVEAPPASPAPVAHPAPVEAPAKPSPTPKASSGEAEENTRFSQGTVGNYGSRNYPSIARERGWVGTVTVKIRVSADAEIEDVSIVNSSGHDVLDEYAIDKIQSASRVVPCHRGDKPVACTFTQSIHFKLAKE